MKTMIVQVSWTLLGVGTSVLAVEDKSSPGMLQIIVFLCGLLSVLFSIIFSGMLKHFSSHSEFKEELTRLLTEYRKVKDCEGRHHDVVALAQLLREMQASQNATTTQTEPKTDAQGVAGQANGPRAVP